MPAEGPRTILLMRHGETSWNRDRRIMGDLDIPLSDAGRGQCEAAARLLAGMSIGRIVSSPLRRAAESAGIVAEALGLEVEEEPRLVEVRFGDWQGLSYEEVAADPRYGEFARDPVRVATPGGETVADVQGRGLAGLDVVCPGECVLFVTHGDIIRTLLCHFLGVPLAGYRRLRVDNAGISAVALTGDSTEIRFLNVLADPLRASSATHWAARP